MEIGVGKRHIEVLDVEEKSGVDSMPSASDVHTARWAWKADVDNGLLS